MDKRGKKMEEWICGAEAGGGAASGGVEAELGIKHSNGDAVALQARSSEALWGERGGGRGHAGPASRARGRGCGAIHGAQREGGGKRDRARGGEEGESGWRSKTRGGEPLAAALRVEEGDGLWCGTGVFVAEIERELRERKKREAVV